MWWCAVGDDSRRWCGGCVRGEVFWGGRHLNCVFNDGGMCGRAVWGVRVVYRVRRVEQWQVFWLDVVHHVRSDVGWELVALA